MPMSGKYFFIKNKSNNLYLDACGLTSNPEKISPGNTQITLWKKRQTPKEEVKNSQVWYWDAVTSTLRNTLYGLCLDVNEDKKAVINFLDIQKSIEQKKLEKKDTKTRNTISILGRYSPLLRRISSSSSINVDEAPPLTYPQQWTFNKVKGAIESVENEDVVLDVVSPSQSSATEVCVSSFCNKNSQIWVMEPIPIRYFYILSKFLSGNVLDVLGGKMSAGAKVGLYVKRKNDRVYNSQLWFEDEIGNIRNKVNDKLVLHATGTSLKTEQPDQTKQRWIVCGNRIVSADDHCMVICLGKKRNSFSIDDHDTYYLCSSAYLGLDSQHWEFLYV